MKNMTTNLLVAVTVFLGPLSTIRSLELKDIGDRGLYRPSYAECVIGCFSNDVTKSYRDRIKKNGVATKIQVAYRDFTLRQEHRKRFLGANSACTAALLKERLQGAAKTGWRTVDLSHLELKDISFIRYIIPYAHRKNLEVMNLSHNQISHVPLAVFTQFPRLAIVILRSNQINRIDALTSSPDSSKNRGAHGLVRVGHDILVEALRARYKRLFDFRDNPLFREENEKQNVAESVYALHGLVSKGYAVIIEEDVVQYECAICLNKGNDGFAVLACCGNVLCVQCLTTKRQLKSCVPCLKKELFDRLEDAYCTSCRLTRCPFCRRTTFPWLAIKNT